MSIDYALMHKIFFYLNLLGDHKLTYLKADEKASLDTVFVPYNLNVAKKTIPSQSRTLID